MSECPHAHVSTTTKKKIVDQLEIQQNALEQLTEDNVAMEHILEIKQQDLIEV
jgi:DNA-directed RNA polymerase subunit H (RpoH/RPB5)